MVGQVGVQALAASSLKAALDLDWDDPATAGVVLARVLEYLVPRQATFALLTAPHR